MTEWTDFWSSELQQTTSRPSDTPLDISKLLDQAQEQPKADSFKRPLPPNFPFPLGGGLAPPGLRGRPLMRGRLFRTS